MPVDDFLKAAEELTSSESSSSNAMLPINGNYELTDEQRATVRELWNNGIEDLKDLIQKVFGEGVDGRSKQGMAVKKFLAEQNLKARPSHVYKKKTNEVNLTDEHKEFIRNNAESMKPLEMARILFDDNQLSSLSAQFRVVREYYDSLTGKKAVVEEEDIQKYNPPKTKAEVLARIDKYVLEGIDRDKMTVKQEEWVDKLRRYMHTHRFVYELNLLSKKSERELFEGAFVKFCYDKPDLTEEEIELYLNYCSDIVSYQRMKQELLVLCEHRDMAMEAEQKMPMALVEAIGKLRSDIDDIGKKMEKTLQGLNGKRADRLAQLQANNESILKLVEAFRDETSRKRILLMAKIRHDEVEKESERLMTMEDLKFQIWGSSRKELT